MGREDEGSDLWEWERPPEVFFCDDAVLSTKVVGPFLYGISCEIYTHFTGGQRDRCQPIVTTDLYMSYTQKLLQEAVQIWGVSVTDTCLQTPHKVSSCSAVEILEICTISGSDRLFD